MRLSEPDPHHTGATAALDALEAILNEETALLEAGRVTEALHLAERKKAAADALRRTLDGAPAHRTDADALRERQARFRRLLSANLAVIATARSVAETLLREVSTSIAPRGPVTYAPPGRAAVALAGAPITLSRKS